MRYINHKPRAKLAKAAVKGEGELLKILPTKKISDGDDDVLRITLGKVKYASAIVTGDIVTFTPPKE